MAEPVLRPHWGRLRFRGRRADYYEYLATLMESSDGRKTLWDIFDDDARRYGVATLRGRMSARWAARYREFGGDLERTFAGTLPHDELMLLRAAQQAGAGALPEALRDMAATARLLDRAWSTFVATMATACLAVLVMFAVLVAVPLYTVPQLDRTFQVVPADYRGDSTRLLFALADLLQAYLPAVVAIGALTAGGLLWTLPNLTGRWRRLLEPHLIWRLYRDFHGIRFLALLSIMVRQRGNVATPLREALLAQLPGASAWKAWHLQQMVVRVDDGVVGAETLRTGMLDPETAWFLSDMVAIHGVDKGLARTRERIENRVIVDVTRRAVALRWGLLLGSVAVLLTMTFWHLGVIDEMRRALQAYYSAR